MGFVDFLFFYNDNSMPEACITPRPLSQVGAAGEF